MKFSTIPSVLAVLYGGLAASSPLQAVSVSEESSLVERSTGSLSAWTGSGNGCSGNPGYTWTNIGNGCITFNDSNGKAKIVQRLSWSGQTCQVYGYSSTGCVNQVATSAGSNLCFNNVLFLSFKVVC
ncbi:hypothetical protein B0H63DRAFT_520609 [Podospora didyma]|uniref:Uncharacterized protein n=1 Tax=Podospora didyma TaxID=330526 RepID=A0AAE0NRT9_9PEZI|nr:hypothetical protein B0H63DRAFT_520609 [Podospora didyma]